MTNDSIYGIVNGIVDENGKIVMRMSECDTEVLGIDISNNKFTSIDLYLDSDKPKKLKILKAYHNKIEKVKFSDVFKKLI